MARPFGETLLVASTATTQRRLIFVAFIAAWIANWSACSLGWKVISFFTAKDGGGTPLVNEACPKSLSAPEDLITSPMVVMVFSDLLPN